MITHTWRAPLGSKHARTPLLERGCAFAGCGQPRSAHPAVDWSRYLKCPVCEAGRGEPCLAQTGFVAGDEDGPIAVVADRPHGGRKERAGAAG